MRVLLIEDDASVAASIELMLKSEGPVANVQRPKKSSPNSTSHSLITHFDGPDNP